LGLGDVHELVFALMLFERLLATLHLAPIVDGFRVEDLAELLHGRFLAIEWSHLELAAGTNAAPSREKNVNVAVALVDNLHAIEHVLRVVPVLDIDFGHEE
jgi:hypothetical protein